LDAALRDLTTRIIEQMPADAELAVIGIRSRGEILAGRVCFPAQDHRLFTAYINFLKIFYKNSLG
jgi:hypothetical protein